MGRRAAGSAVPPWAATNLRTWWLAPAPLRTTPLRAQMTGKRVSGQSDNGGGRQASAFVTAACHASQQPPPSPGCSKADNIKKQSARAAGQRQRVVGRQAVCCNRQNQQSFGTVSERIDAVSGRGAGSGERGAGSGEWGAGSGERGAGSGKRGAGSGERGAGSGERGAGSGERGAGSGRSCMAGEVLADAAKADARGRACSPRPATEQTLPSPARCAGVIKGRGLGWP
jgi:hypothetical protein